MNTPTGEPLWEEASASKKSLTTLSRAKPHGHSVNALYAEAEHLMSDAQARPASDPGADMFFLRATAVIHELLMLGSPKDIRVDALSWLDVSYHALRDLDIWSLHLFYDAACVEEAPHSVLAGECYQRWIDSARVAFTGNGGGDLPEPLARQAKKLMQLAAPSVNEIAP